MENKNKMIRQKSNQDLCELITADEKLQSNEKKIVIDFVFFFCIYFCIKSLVNEMNENRK